MKKYKCILPFFVLVFIITSCSDKILVRGDTYAVTLEVETKIVTSTNLEQTCNFGQKAGISNEDYTLVARLGDNVLWSGLSSDSGGTDKVRILSIDHVSGPNFFNADTLTSNGQGRVFGTIVSGKPDEVSKYSIRFNVFNDGTQRNGTFEIDPKIRIKKR